MKFLKEFSNWNPKLNKQVLDFIEQNKKYLVTNFFDMKKSEDENMKDLKYHLTKYFSSKLPRLSFSTKN